MLRYHPCAIQVIILLSGFLWVGVGALGFPHLGGYAFFLTMLLAVLYPFIHEAIFSVQGSGYMDGMHTIYLIKPPKDQDIGR